MEKDIVSDRELTVEEVLKELREMFDHRSEITFEVLDDLPLEEEVRQLLLTTRRQVLPSGPCWCGVYLPYLGHTEDCLLSRALLQRLDAQEKQQ